MLLALFLAAAAQAKPPAHLVVPKSLQEKRSGQDLRLPQSIFDDPKLAEALGPLRPAVGSWVEYAIRSAGAGGVRARFSVLPPELPGGKFWLEVYSISEDAPPSAAKLLVRGRSLKDVERAFIYVPGQAPIELPLDLGAGAPKPDRKPAPRRPPPLRRGEAETVQVKAGRFEKAETLRVGDTRIWRSGAVPLWGLVKAQSPRQTLELAGSGTSGAHSVFPPGWGDEPQGTGSESTK